MPRLRVRPATAADALAMQTIRWDAFRPGPISQTLWPGEMTPEAHALAIRKLQGEVAQRGGGPGHFFVLVAEQIPDGAAGDVPSEDSEDLLADGYAPDAAPIAGAEIVAYAKWNLYATPRPAAEWDVDTAPPTREELGPGTDLELWDAFIGDMKRRRRACIGGRAHFLLDFLATSPARQRTGAGGALIRWGTRRADARGLECWIEATPAGHALYRRHGFEDVSVLDLDLKGRWGREPREGEDWGTGNALEALDDEQKTHGHGWYRVVLMQRPVKK